MTIFNMFLDHFSIDELQTIFLTHISFKRFFVAYFTFKRIILNLLEFEAYLNVKKLLKLISKKKVFEDFVVAFEA